MTEQMEVSADFQQVNHASRGSHLSGEVGPGCHVEFYGPPPFPALFGLKQRWRITAVSSTTFFQV